MQINQHFKAHEMEYKLGILQCIDHRVNGADVKTFQM